MSRSISIEKHDRILFWYVFFTVFSIPVIYFNLSFYLFPILLLSYKKKFHYVFKYNGIEQILAVLFGVGAILSSAGTIFNVDKGNFADAIVVLPNYLYWCIIIIFFVSQKDNLNYRIIVKAIFHGLLVLICYHFLLQDLGLNELFIFKHSSQNAFAFSMICFSPIGVYYIMETRGILLTIIIILLFSFCALLSLSRAGSILVIMGNLALLLYSYSKHKRLFVATFLLLCIIVISAFKSDIFWDTIHSYNPRVYKLVTDIEWVLTRDTSYLIRKAQLEKGIEMFKKHPLRGIGLNGFENYTIYQPLDFKGYQWVKWKEHTYHSSSHNSYINILAEGGLLLFIPFICLLLLPLIRVLINIKSINVPEVKIPTLIGFICMAIHLYFITAIINMFAWFLIGMTLALTNNKKV